ncbi:MAG: MotA/TolQ/ExbB proton channel family protein [Candidatus Eisenbacteria bacterium]|nr:MotA/TolQ/ExbB proton channel family protein [Candidatus Eisenbacteria bacterium]
MVDFYVRGGFFMHPILLCSILGLAIILERAYVLSRARTDAKKLVAEMLNVLKSGGPEEARALLQKTRGPIAAILHAGLLRADAGLEAIERSILTAAAIEVSFLERGLIWLASIANIAPLLGFLGTVSGMIHAFEAIAAAEQVSPKLVADGIAEALITTAAGLIVAIPVQAAYNYFVQRIERYSVDMEESSHDLLDALTQGTFTTHSQAT